MKKIVNTIQTFNTAMGNNDYSFDIYFRMAVIDNYLRGNEEIWKLYFEMQRIRCQKIKEVKEEMINHKTEFISLINNFKLYGYDFNYPILLNKDGLIIDGAHRMACSIYFDIPSISTYTNRETYDFVPADYSKKWFEDNNLYECIIFGEEEKKKYKEKIKCISQKKF